MIKSGAIIINNKYGAAQEKIIHKITRLKEEFSLLDVGIDVIKNDGMLFCIKDGIIVINIKPYDFIIYLDKDIYTAKALNNAGYHLFSDPSFMDLCDDKLLTHIEVSKLGINTPNIISSPLSFYYSEDDGDELFVEQVIKQLSLPFVFKLTYGSLGEGVHLVNSYSEGLKLYRKYKTTPHFYQQYIETANESIRVLIVDGKIVTCISRHNENDFRSNSVNGISTSKLYTPSESLLDDVNKLIEHFDIEYAGIDFLVDKNNKHYFLEMNSNAFFSHAEKISGLNIAALYAKYVLKNLK